MPPFFPRKRRLSSPPEKFPQPKAVKRSLFDTVDAHGSSKSTVEDNKAFARTLDADESDSLSSLSDVDSADFEDVPEPDVAADESDEDVAWEDAVTEKKEPEKTQEPLGDLELTLDDDEGRAETSTNALGGKKGPSKKERQIRLRTHCMHVQFLLFHNLVRNTWTCNKEVQKILVEQLPESVRKDIARFRIASGLQIEAEEPPEEDTKRSKKGRKKKIPDRNQRDWGADSDRLEPGKPDMSRGDPIIPLMKRLAAYWRKKFNVTAPGLRKRGYKPLATLKEEVAAFREKNDQDEHGERVGNLNEFRDAARKCEGSRDVGAQLFTALIRGLDVEARLVASLQPLGFGWTKGEETNVSKTTKEKRQSAAELQSDVSEENLNEDSDESIIDVTPSKPKRSEPKRKYDRDLVVPIYWTEVISPITRDVIPVESFVLQESVFSTQESLPLFEPRGAKADKAKQVMAYVVGYSADGTAKDVTTRYLKRHVWPGKTKGVRMPVEKVPVYNKRGKIKRHEEYDWFKSVMSAYLRSDKMRTVVDDQEEQKDLKPVKHEKKASADDKDTLQSLKSSADFVLERHLRREEALRPGAKPVRTFSSGKGDKAREEDVYLRKDIKRCLSAESWHKEGRQVREGEVPMKRVPVRAMTLIRKREVEEVERESGEKMLQGLYALDQTEFIIPPPIENGVIPRNAYGNMDCFAPSMIPNGAIHIPLRRTAAICKKLGIDFAEAVTGFEFGKQRAVPVVEGVVVAVENENAVIDAWEAEEAERQRKEDVKREKLILSTWRKLLFGLRITQRVNEEYGEAHLKDKESVNPFMNAKARKNAKDKKDEMNEGGGFLIEEHEDEPRDSDGMDVEPGGFMVDGDVDGVDNDTSGAHGGGFLPEDDEEEESAALPNSSPARSASSPSAEDALAANGDDAEPPSDRDRFSSEMTSPPSTPSSKTLKRASKRAAPPTPPSQNPQRASKRAAAKNSGKAIRSHYFEEDKDEDSEEEEEVEKEVEKPVQTPKRKTAPTRGRGRGRPRGSRKA